MNKNIETVLRFIDESVPGLQIDVARDGDKPLLELGIDSLDRMSILLAVQEEWDLEFSEEELSKILSINDIVGSLSS